MNARERVWAALEGRTVDRPPVGCWGHVYHRESSAEELAEATLEFHREYRWDWIKLNPRKHYHVEPWNVRYRYSGVPHEKPVLERWPIHRAEDWDAVAEVPATAAAFAEQVEAVRLVRRALPPDVPLIETVFTPLAVLGEMTETPEVLRAHMHAAPERVHRALEAVTRTFERLVPALLDAGAEGLFFATVDWGTRDYIAPNELATWARPYDRRVLGAAARAPFNVLHVCKRNNLLFEYADYPVRAFSWSATDATNPSLGAALARLPGAVMGGIGHEGTLLDPRPEGVLEELRRGFEDTGGRRWLVAPGCSILPGTRPTNLRALRDAVETMAVHERSP